MSPKVQQTTAEPAGPSEPAVVADPPTSLAALMLSLPPGLLAHVFSSLRCVDVAAAAAVCSAWRDVVDQEVVAWTHAMAELDPFCSLGGSDSAFKLFHAAGDSWLCAAAALAGCVESCTACLPGRDAKAAGEVLCLCNPMEVDQKMAACTAGGSMPSDDASDEDSEGGELIDNRGPIMAGQPPEDISTGDFVKSCTAHCAHCEGCVQLNGRLINRWLLDPRRLDFCRGDDADVEAADGILVGDGTIASGKRLQAKLRNPFMYACKILRISGEFLFDDAEHLIVTGEYVRIVGDGTAVIRPGDPIYPMAELTVLENVRVEVQRAAVCACPDFCTLCSNGMGGNPAVHVKEGCRLIALKLVAISEYGPSVLLGAGASAFLQDCTLATRCVDGKPPVMEREMENDPYAYDKDEPRRAEVGGAGCAGVDAQSDCKPAMYDCTVKDANFGVAAGSDARVLGRQNTCSNIHKARFIATVVGGGREECVGQVVQPWREDWAVPPAPRAAGVP
ncbi:hypothetical protein FOA52_004657 [Chlamydomonas sp. UWO 241]|nr:hypothetical protein FOA52_004657 [Chlamydomonas sp. UWO 241]